MTINQGNPTSLTFDANTALGTYHLHLESYDPQNPTAWVFHTDHIDVEILEDYQHTASVPTSVTFDTNSP